AGSHTTSGTLTLLFSQLLQNPPVLGKVVAEIDSDASTVPGRPVQITGLEQRLPYSMACIQENFRVNAVFTMPFPRKLAVTGGIEVDGHLVPENVRSPD
ncbi:uncharacterized protein A1O9_09643, partial [Exophiala aquamarina CBS 119918]